MHQADLVHQATAGVGNKVFGVSVAAEEDPQQTREEGTPLIVRETREISFKLRRPLAGQTERLQHPPNCRHWHFLIDDVSLDIKHNRRNRERQPLQLAQSVEQQRKQSPR